LPAVLATRCPVHDAKRIQFLADVGETFYTEYQPLDFPSPLPRSLAPLPAGRTIAVAGIRRHGIGEAIADAFVARGDFIVACDKDRAAGLEAVAHVCRRNVEIKFVEADVGTPQGVERFMEEIAVSFGCLDALVCNIGSAGDPRNGKRIDEDAVVA
jgi:hypothetical protein